MSLNGSSPSSHGGLCRLGPDPLSPEGKGEKGRGCEGAAARGGESLEEREGRWRCTVKPRFSPLELGAINPQAFFSTET